VYTHPKKLSHLINWIHSKFTKTRLQMRTTLAA